MTTAYQHASIIAAELGIKPDQVERTVALLTDGATIPFISRYRKEVTGNLDEVQIGSIDERRSYLDELFARKETVLKEIGSQGKLSDELKKKIEATLSKTELEDLYLPYKPKRRTRATIAREKGLEPLAEQIWAQGELDARPFVNDQVPDVAAALAGARDIVAERVSEEAEVRAALRDQALQTGALVSTVIPGKETEGAKFKDYFELREPVEKAPSHRLLALRRGEKEGFLRVALEVDEARAVDLIRHKLQARTAEMLAAVDDSYQRLLKPSIEVDVRLHLKERADAEAIKVFAENLRNLLLQSPLG